MGVQQPTTSLPTGGQPILPVTDAAVPNAKKHHQGPGSFRSETGCGVKHHARKRHYDSFDEDSTCSNRHPAKEDPSQRGREPYFYVIQKNKRSDSPVHVSQALSFDEYRSKNGLVDSVNDNRCRTSSSVASPSLPVVVAPGTLPSSLRSPPPPPPSGVAGLRKSGSYYRPPTPPKNDGCGCFDPLGLLMEFTSCSFWAAPCGTADEVSDETTIAQNNQGAKIHARESREHSLCDDDDDDSESTPVPTSPLMPTACYVCHEKETVAEIFRSEREMSSSTPLQHQTGAESRSGTPNPYQFVQRC